MHWPEKIQNRTQRNAEEKTLDESLPCKLRRDHRKKPRRCFGSS